MDLLQARTLDAHIRLHLPGSSPGRAEATISFEFQVDGVSQGVPQPSNATAAAAACLLTVLVADYMGTEVDPLDLEEPGQRLDDASTL